MKKTLLKTIFIIIAFTFLIGMFGLAELLSKVITMDLVINICYISLVAGIIYFIKN